MTMITQHRKQINLTLAREEVFEFLVRLRNSGITNMWGASPYIHSQFGCSREEASYWLQEWIDSFKPKSDKI